jgi:coproporphyrinogen III oxidase-like Fe-S oxidoreductase
MRLGLYFHIPFCASLCTFCGCHMRVVRNHALATPYVNTLLAELALYRQRLARSELPIGELHLGGGTPTFLPAAELDRLLDGLLGDRQSLLLTDDQHTLIQAAMKDAFDEKPEEAARRLMEDQPSRPPRPISW